MEDDLCGDRSHTSEVIASRVATTDFAASSTKGDRHDECGTDVPSAPARPTRRCRGQWCNCRVAGRRCGFPRKLVGVMALMRGALAASGGVQHLRRWASVPKPPDA